MRIRMVQSGSERGDCTAPYDVIIIEGGTVNDFIDMVLSNKEEWGYIGIKYRDTFIGEPHMEYRHGRALSNGLKAYGGRVVTKVQADGGWSRMDYVLEVKEQEHE